MTWEESKQADRTTGQAAHKVSRGIHDKVAILALQLYTVCSKLFELVGILST